MAFSDKAYPGDSIADAPRIHICGLEAKKSVVLSTQSHNLACPVVGRSELLFKLGSGMLFNGPADPEYCAAYEDNALKTSHIMALWRRQAASGAPCHRWGTILVLQLPSRLTGRGKPDCRS